MTEIVGAEIAARSEPIKIQWQRPADGEEREPGTLILRVEGPAAIEIQHSTNVICERVNQFLGWRAIARVALAPGAAAARGAQAGKDQRPGRGRAGGGELAGYRRRRFKAGAGPAGRGGQTRLTRGQHQPTVTAVPLAAWRANATLFR